jgi:hypothetical protein
MKWSDAITAVQDKLRAFDDYVDRHNTVGDLTELNQEYTPEQIRGQVQEAIDVANRMLNALSGDEDADAV